MAGKTPMVHVALTTNLGKLLYCLNGLSIGGSLNISSSIKVALLALKRRTTDPSQLGARRIICFVGSPVIESVEDMEALGSVLKKNNIAIDVVDFGEEKKNNEKFEAFIRAAMGGQQAENEQKTCSHIPVPAGPHVLANLLLGTSLFPSGSQSGGVGGRSLSGSAASAAGGGDVDMSVGDEEDAELQMVLRMSAEEEMRRQQKLKEGQPSTGTPSSSSTMNTGQQQLQTTSATGESSLSQQQASTTGTGGAMDVDMTGVGDEDDEEIQRAIRLSLLDHEQRQSTKKDIEDNKKNGASSGDVKMTDSPSKVGVGAEHDDDELYGSGDDGKDVDEEDEDAQLKKALMISKQQQHSSGSSSSNQPSSKPSNVRNDDDNIKDILQDDAYLDQFLKTLPGASNANKKEDQKKKDNKKEEGKKNEKDQK